MRRLEVNPERPIAAPPELHDGGVVETIKNAFLRSYLKRTPRTWIDSERGHQEIDREIRKKYNDCVRFVLPWLRSGGVDLAAASVAEIGCGTGSKSVALAQVCRTFVGCDHSEELIEAAKGRAHAMGVTNAQFLALPTEAFLDRLEERKGDIDVIVLYAVLEHLTVSERMRTLQRAWNLLPDGGHLVVAETPNRLLPWDYHSSQLPFFHTLPDELALLYAHRSPRKGFIEGLVDGAPRAEREVRLARKGRGVSYHEFELAFGGLEVVRQAIVADGYDLPMLRLDQWQRDEGELSEFVRREKLEIPAAFTRYWIAGVFQKGRTGPMRPAPVNLRARAKRLTHDEGGRLVLHSPLSFVDFVIPEDASELILGTEAAPPLGDWLVTDGSGTELARLSSRGPVADGHWHDHEYHRVPLPAGTREVRVSRQPGRGLIQAALQSLMDQDRARASGPLRIIYAHAR